MDYFITQPAEQDLVDIWDYIACDNEDAADKLIEKFFDVFIKLTENPYIGHKRKDLTNKKVLFWCLKHYLIVYKVNTSNLDILRVLSSYRNIASIISH